MEPKIQNALNEIHHLRRKGKTAIEVWSFILNSPLHRQAWQQSNSDGKIDLLMWEFFHRFSELAEWEKDCQKVEIVWPDLLHVCPKNILNQAVEVLAKQEEKVFSLLKRWLEDEDKIVRKNAVWILGKIDKEKEKTFPLLYKALSDPDEDVRVYATSSIENRENQEAIKALPLMLKNLEEGGENLQLFTAIALKKIDTDEVEVPVSFFQDLEKKGNSISPHAQTILKGILKRRKRKKATTTSSRRGYFLYFVLWVCFMGILFYEDIQKNIIKVRYVFMLLGDEPDYYTKREVTLEISKLWKYSGEPLPILIEDLNHSKWGVRMRASRTIGEFGTKTENVILALIAALQDKHWNVRYHTIFSLQKLNSPKMAAKIKEALQKSAENDPDEYVRRAARQVLQSFEEKN